MVEDGVLELVDPLGGEEGGLVLGQVLVGGSPVVRSPHPRRVEVAAYEEEDQTDDVAGEGRQQEPVPLPATFCNIIQLMAYGGARAVVHAYSSQEAADI